MKMSETIEFLLKNRNSLNPAVLKTVLSSIEPDTTEELPEGFGPVVAEDPNIKVWCNKIIKSIKVS